MNERNMTCSCATSGLLTRSYGRSGQDVRSGAEVIPCPPNLVIKGSGCWGKSMLGTGQVGRQPQGTLPTVTGGKKGPRAKWLSLLI